ncbi:MAG: CsgG/HfaB family protein [Calditerrivibrio sp.]|nr:CsgG/HfaB family protein [Calditerrivibrio sp.]
MRFFKYLSVLAVVFLFACAQPPKLDPGAMQITPADQEQVQVPKICEAQYQGKKYKVAVVDFANNTGYGDMKAVNTQIQGQSQTTTKSAGVAGVVVGPGAAGVGYAGVTQKDHKYSADINTFYREIAPNLGQYAQSAVEDAIMKIGGVQVFTRQQVGKVLQEQGFQMNMADPNTVTKFGKISGVDYIITGTVDLIKAHYVQRTKNDTNTGNVWVNLALAATKAAVDAATVGWNVNTEMTVQLIDASTGQLVLSKKVKGRELAGEQPAFNPELVVNAAKKAFGESVDDIKPEFSDLFGAKAYINQLRGGKQVALVSLGKADGIQPGNKIEAYEFMEIQDFMTKKMNCQKTKIDVDIIVSNQVDENSAWVKIEGKPENIKRLKVGTLVKRAPLEGQGFMKKLF